MSASLKAGLIGAAIAVLLALLGMIPCVGLCTWILVLVLYVVVGVLAANWMEPPRGAGKAAGRGAMAGLITALVGGTVNVLISAGRFTIGGGRASTMRQLEQLPPEYLEPLYDLGVDPAALVGPEWAIGGSALCCGAGLVVAAALGAIGGAIAASARRD